MDVLHERRIDLPNPLGGSIWRFEFAFAGSNCRFEFDFVSAIRFGDSIWRFFLGQFDLGDLPLPDRFAKSIRLMDLANPLA
jgi:hypothetical protein